MARVQVAVKGILMAALLSLPLIGQAPEFKAGGVTLSLPGPTNFEESGDRLRTTLFELLAPSTNRLLSAYVPVQTLAELNKGKVPTAGMNVYALVEVPRRAEYADCTPQVFESLLSGMESSMGKVASEKVGQVQEEMNIRLKSLGTKPVEFGHPEMLGGIFKKSDAGGFAMLLAVKQDTGSVTMAAGIAALRLKQRLIFAYLYRRYDSPETVALVSKDLETWTDALLAKNQ